MKIREVKRLLAMATVATTLTATTLTGCGKVDEPTTDVAVEDTIEDTTEETDTGGKKVVLADTEKDENTEIGTVQNREPAKQTTQDGQAYDDLLEEEGATKLETDEEFTVVPFQTTFYVSSETNVYEKPDNTSTVVGKVTYNTEIITTGKVEEVEWYKFQLDGKEVYISKSFLSEKKLELEETTTTSTTPEQSVEQTVQDIVEQQLKNNDSGVTIITNPSNYDFGDRSTVTDGSNIDWDRDNQWTGKITVH